jgi:hypothetical protein
LRVSMLVGPWIHRIQAKCFNIGIVVGLKIHLMQAVLLPLTVRMMIENLMFTLCSRDCVILSRINSFFAVS